jgi:hypothetical protein
MSYGQVNAIHFDGVSLTTSDNSTELGARLTDSDGNQYVYVYNASSYQIWPGRSAYLLSLTSGYSITATNAASQAGFFAGGVHHATIPTNYYGWIMTDGCCRVSPDTSAVSFDAGDYLVPGVNDGYSAAPATISTISRLGLCISSGVTHEGASLASCGKAWIKSTIW